MIRPVLRGVHPLSLGAFCGLIACSGSKSPDLGPAGGPIDGGMMAGHCLTDNDGGPKVTTVNPAACHPDAGTKPDAAPVDAGAAMMNEFGATMDGQEGDDDDCKYHLRWTSTPVHQNVDITFTVLATYKVDGRALTGASPYVEAFLSDTHPVPNSNTNTTESPPGTYEIGPVRFDAPGDWTVRFHFAALCADSEESAHGHAAFFVRVP
jgi:hypothetical protein